MGMMTEERSERSEGGEGRGGGKVCAQREWMEYKRAREIDAAAAAAAAATGLWLPALQP